MSAIVQPKAAKSARAHFKWDDPFLLDEQLSDDERMIRDTARDYAQECKEASNDSVTDGSWPE